MKDDSVETAPIYPNNSLRIPEDHSIEEKPTKEEVKVQEAPLQILSADNSVPEKSANQIEPSTEHF